MREQVKKQKRRRGKFQVERTVRIWPQTLNLKVDYKEEKKVLVVLFERRASIMIISYLTYTHLFHHTFVPFPRSSGVMAAPSDTNAHTTISKLRSRFGGLGKNGLGRGSNPSTSASSPAKEQGTAAAAAASPPHRGIDYSPEARNFVAKKSLRQLYSPIDAFKKGMLKVDDRHEVYYEVCGNEKGAPGESKQQTLGLGYPSS
jgi:hypothetical protein